MAMTPRSTVVGVFDSRDRARDAITELQKAGFREDQIGFAMRGGDAPAGATATVETTHAGSAAVTGGLLGALAGAAAMLLIPGVGPVLALGTLGGSILTGAVAGGALGALAGALIGMGVPEDEARYYEGEFNQGRAVLTVKAENRAPEAEAILRRFGAYDVNTRGTTTGNVAAATTTASAPAARVAENADTVKLREEQLNVEKERVQTGQVEIGKRVVEERKSMEVPVTREEVTIERHAVNRPSNTPIGADENATIRATSTQERVNVDKQTFVREEVGVRKQVTQETVPVSETVRREEAVINRTGADMGAKRDWNAEMPAFRQHWQTTYGSTGRWDEYEPMYRYGFDQYSSGRWSGRSWADVEPEFRRDWSARYPGQSWDVASNPIKHAWDHLTATPHTHTR